MLPEDLPSAQILGGDCFQQIHIAGFCSLKDVVLEPGRLTLLIGLVELLLQLVAEGHQVGPNSGNTNNHIRFCHHWVADLGWEQVER